MESIRHKKKILVTGDFDLVPEATLNFDVVHLRTPRNHEDVIAKLAGCWGYVLGGPEYLSADIIAKVPALQHVAVMGTGTSSFVDQTAALRAGLQVHNTPSINAAAVGEFTQSLLVASLANLFASVENLKTGASWYQTPRIGLADASIGFLGMGSISQNMVARLSETKSTRLSYFSRTRRYDLEEKFNLFFKPLKTLLHEVDAVCIHVTYSDQTHHMISTDELASAHPSIRLLNLSHPQIIDPAALKSFLAAHLDSFCFLDGYYREWIENLGVNHDPYGLLELGPAKFVAASHIAAQEKSTVQRILEKALQVLTAQIPEKSS
jgi:lactate dehydrogenase-like 2-hydroxyacid dehydrogenase